VTGGTLGTGGRLLGATGGGRRRTHHARALREALPGPLAGVQLHRHGLPGERAVEARLLALA